MNDEIQEGDIVQIIDETHAWFPCLLVVSEVKLWGVIAYAFIPQKNDGSEPVAQAFNRLESKQIYKVGVTAIGVA
mgnify:CR=1 FL=1